MAKSRVSLLLQVQDNASRQLRSFNSILGSSTRHLHGLVGGALALAGVGGLGMLSRSLIKAASDAEEIQSKFDVVFGEVAEQANAWAESFSQTFGRSERDVKKWMGTLQDTFVPLGYARNEAFQLSQKLTELAIDVASFNNAADADVIRDFTSALVGNHETVRKYGILISESSIKQQALNEGINKSYKQLTDLEKVQLRYSLILKGTTDAQGDALRTANTFANQYKRLTGNIDDLKVTLGDVLLPSMTQAVSNLNKLLIENKDVIRDWAESISEYLPFTLRSIKAFHAGINESLAGIYELAAALDKFVPSFMIGDKLLRRYLEMEPWAERAAELRKEAEKLLEEAYSGFPAISLPIEKEQTLLAPKLPEMEIPEISEEAQKATSKIDSLIESLERQAQAIDLVNTGQAKSIKMAEFMLTAYEAYGSGTDRATEAINRYQVALSKIEASEAAARMEERNQRIEAEIGLIGRIGQSWEHAKDRTENARDAVLRYGEGSLEAAAAIEEFDKKLQRLELANRWQKMIDVMESSFSNAMERMIFEGENFGNVMKMIFREIMMEAIRIKFIRPAADILAGALGGLMGGLFGKPNYTKVMYAHEGGVAGAIDRMTWVPASVFENAQRFHSGLGPNEIPGILERGEIILPAGTRFNASSETKPKITVNNYGVPVKIDETASRFDVEEIVITLINENYNRGGSIYDLLKR